MVCGKAPGELKPIGVILAVITIWCHLIEKHAATTIYLALPNTWKWVILLDITAPIGGQVVWKQTVFSDFYKYMGVVDPSESNDWLLNTSITNNITKK